MSDTPIYDALVIEHQEANAEGDLQEGRDLVAGIHARKAADEEPPTVIPEPLGRLAALMMLGGLSR